MLILLLNLIDTNDVFSDIMSQVVVVRLSSAGHCRQAIVVRPSSSGRPHQAVVVVKPLLSARPSLPGPRQVVIVMLLLARRLCCQIVDARPLSSGHCHCQAIVIRLLLPGRRCHVVVVMLSVIRKALLVLFL